QSRDVLAVEDDASAVRADAASEDVEAGGLACSLGADDAAELPGRVGQRDVLQHDVIAEALVEALGLEQGHGQSPAAGCNATVRPRRRARSRADTLCQIPATPSGLNITTSMNMRPNQRSHDSV